MTNADKAAAVNEYITDTLAHMADPTVPSFLRHQAAATLGEARRQLRQHQIAAAQDVEAARAEEQERRDRQC